MRISALLCLFAAMASFLSGCSENSSTVQIRVITGLVPGPEFRLVQTELLDTHLGPSATRVIESYEAVARLGMDYAHGQNVATFTLADGSYRVRVQLRRPNGDFLVERVVAFTVSGNFIVPVHITRDCVGVECPLPGGAAELSTCLQGRCVDPRCSAAAPEFCPDITFCAAATECSPVAECALAACVDGLCTPAPVETFCDSTAWCNPDVGCQPLTPTTSGGIDCGTICTTPGDVCRFGYWKCAEGLEPMCEDLIGRPVGHVCAPGRVCDEEANCVVPVVESPSIVVSPTSGLITMERGGSAAFTVVLGTLPTADVSIALSSDTVSEGTASPSNLTFTASNWNAPQTVTVDGVDDVIADGNTDYLVVLAPAVSADSGYAGIDADDVHVTNIDDETPGVTVSRMSGLVTNEAGSSDTFEITLNAAPTSDVTISLASDNVFEATVLPSLLTFTPADYATAHTVTVTGVDDALRDGDRAFTIETSATSSTDSLYNSLDVGDVHGTNIDDDLAFITVSPSTALTTSESGSVDTFSFVLAVAPTADVVISLTSSDTGEGIPTPSSLTFTATNWNTPQSAMVTGVDDAVVDGPVSYAIITTAASADAAYDGLVLADLAVTNTDNDIAGVTVTPTTGLTTTEGGGTATFDLVLDAQPSADVTISLTSSDLTEGTAFPTSVTFTALNWDMPQSVTVTGVDDPTVDADVAYTIVTSNTVSADLAFNALGVSDVSVTNTDNDVVGVTVTPVSGLLTSEVGGVATFTMVLTSQPTANVSISLTSSNTLEGTVSPGSVTFTSSDWSMPQTITVTGVDDGIVDGRAAYTIVTAPATSADAYYNGLAVADVSVGNIGVVPREYVKASLTEASDLFGSAISLSGDGNTMVVQSYGEDSNATGIGGDQSNNGATDSGALYVFVRMGATWVQQAYIKQSNTGMGDNFGTVVKLSFDGNTLAASAPYESSNATGIGGDQSNDASTWAGAVYVFTRSGTMWSQQAYVKASNTGSLDYFGAALALSSDGTTMAVGTYSEDSNATGINGIQSNNAAADSGAAYVFVRVGMVWSQEAYIKASNASAQDWFARQLAISSDGNTLVATAPEEDSNATGVNGNQSDNSMSASGAVYVFARSAGVWTQQAYVKASNTNASDRFSYSIALASNGDTLAVGAHYEASNATGVGGDQLNNAASYSGAVYVFTRAAGVWTQQAYLKASNTGTFDFFGCSVALSSDGNALAVGAFGEASNAVGVDGDQTNNSKTYAGAAYVFTRAGALWTQQAYVKSSNSDASDYFGQAVDLTADGRTLLVSAPQEDSNATAIDGPQSDNSASNAGALYFYRL